MPSGAIQTLTPRAIASPHSLIAAIASARSPERVTRTKPASRMARPHSGTLNSSALATMRRVPGKTLKRMRDVEVALVVRHVDARAIARHVMQALDGEIDVGAAHDAARPVGEAAVGALEREPPE